MEAVAVAAAGDVVAAEGVVVNPALAYRPQRLLLQWHITHRCNLRCAHCYQDSYAGGDTPMATMLDILEQYRAFIAAAGIRGHITVTGGEPFVHADLMALLEIFAQQAKEYSFAILSNGYFITPSIAQQLKTWGIGFVQVSLEGGKSSHDAIRGEGDFERTCASIKLLKQAGVKTLVSFTAHRANFREFAEVSRIARRLGVDKVWSDRFIPADKNSVIQPLTPAETEAYSALIARERQRLKIRWFNKTEIAGQRALQFLHSGGQPYRCSAADSLITIMPNGDLYPCRRLPILAGNVLQTPLTQLYDDELFQSLRTPREAAPGCASCLYKHLCNGGLKCLSYATSGSPHTADPGCWLATPT